MTSYRIAIVGGTGAQGKGLAHRFVRAGHHVVLGSRSGERAVEVAREVSAHAGAGVSGTTNDVAARDCDVVVVAVPYDGHDALITALADELADRVVISCVNPLGFDRRGAYGLQLPDGSAAEEAQRIVPKARMTAAFHHVSAVSLWRHDGPLTDEDVLVCGDDVHAKQVAIDLAEVVTGRPGIDVGALRLAHQLESLTAVLIGVNKLYRIRSGLRISGLPEA
jgi:NADPH-dependent F420 reductase